jgi:hypothetical protein
MRHLEQHPFQLPVLKGAVVAQGDAADHAAEIIGQGSADDQGSRVADAPDRGGCIARQRRQPRARQFGNGLIRVVALVLVQNPPSFVEDEESENPGVAGGFTGEKVVGVGHRLGVQSEIETEFEGAAQILRQHRQTRFGEAAEGALEFGVIQQHGQTEREGDERQNRGRDFVVHAWGRFGSAAMGMGRRGVIMTDRAGMTIIGQIVGVGKSFPCARLDRTARLGRPVTHLKI